MIQIRAIFVLIAVCSTLALTGCVASSTGPVATFPDADEQPRVAAIKEGISGQNAYEEAVARREQQEDYSAMGNAIAPPIGSAVGREVRAIIREEREAREAKQQRQLDAAQKRLQERRESREDG